MSSILVLGASGFIGTYLTRHLLNNGRRVIGTFRTTALKERYIDAGPNFAYESGVDLSDEHSLKRVFSKHNDISTVIHLAFVMDFYPDKETQQLMYKVNIKGSEVLLDLIREYQKTNGRRVHLIFTSSQEAMGPVVEYDVNNEKQAATELTECDPEYLYGEHKKLVEEMLESQSLGSDPIDYTILRLCGVTGKGDRYGAFELIQAASRGWLLAYPGPAYGMNSFTHVTDVIHALELTINQPENAKNQIFIIGSDDSTTFRQSIDIITRATGWPQPLFTIPHSVFRGIVSLLYPLYNQIRVLTGERRQAASFLFHPKTVDCLIEDRWYSCDKAKTVLGYKPMKIATALKLSSQEFIEEGAISTAGQHLSRIVILTIVSSLMVYFSLRLFSQTR